MRTKHLIISLLAVAALFQGCKEEIDFGLPEVNISTADLAFDMEGGSNSTVTVNATRDWTASTDVDWIAITPSSGKAYAGPETVTIRVLSNEAYDRSAAVLFNIGFDYKTLTVKQAGARGSADAAVVYYNDFDKVLATNTFGSGTSWPYFDQFDGWKNETGSGASTVDYGFSGLSARANSESSGSYSDYDGSGKNNVFFGGNGFLWVKDITLPEGIPSYTVSFGTEKYDNNNKTAPFDKGEFHIYISNDAKKWVELSYNFTKSEAPVARWDLATSTFNVPDGTAKLHIYVKSDIASVHRLDDLKLMQSLEAGPEVDFESGITIPGTDPDAPIPEERVPSADDVYYNDFDKAEATKTYGSGSSYPYLDQFDGWKNEIGTGAAAVDYAFNGLSARSNSTTDGTYSLYKGSGLNNIFFGTNGWMWVKNITLPEGKQNFTLSFGSEKYDNNNKEAPFSHNEFHVYVSDNAAKWVELNYTFAQGSDPVGKYDLASSSFAVPAGTSTLHVYVKCDVASQYRMDDLWIYEAEAPATLIDFASGIEIEGTGEVTPPEPPTPATEKVYYNDFDKEVAGKTYGSGNSYPYLDQFDGWKNETGTGAAEVGYEFNGISARSNSNTDGDYSLYAGSGKNNLFFGTDAWLWVKNIALPEGKQDFKLSFGAEKYDNNNKTAPFNHSEFHVYISDDAAKWVELSYTFAQGSDPVGKYDLASSSFTVPSGTAKLHIYIKCDVASQYRLDDLGIEISETAGTAVDFSSGIEIEGTGGGGETPPEPPTPEVKDPVEVSIPGFAAAEAAEDQPYSLFGKVGEISDPAHGAIVLTDGTTSINVLSISATDLGYGSTDDGSFEGLGVKEGDKVRLIGFKVKEGEADALAYAYLVRDYGAPDAKTVTFAVGDAEWTASNELGGGFEATYQSILFGYYTDTAATDVAAPYLDSDPKHIRVVKYAKFKIVPPEGCFVTNILLKTPGKNYVKEPVAENGTFTLDAETDFTISWEGCMSPFVADTDGGQVRITEFTVTYE